MIRVVYHREFNHFVTVVDKLSDSGLLQDLWFRQFDTEVLHHV